MAVDGVRRHSGTADIDFAKESRADSLWALAGSVGEIPDSLFVAGQHRQPSGQARRSRRSANRVVHCAGESQPALHAADGACDFSSCSLDISSKSGPSASGNPRGSVALRIRGSPFRMVRALAADFRSHAGSGALTGRTRSRSAAPRGAPRGNTEADRVLVVAGFSGTG